MIKTIEYIDGVVRMIDQTRLPAEKEFVDCRTIEEVGHAIKTMVIRGAPAIGVAAAMGVSLGADSIEASTFESFYQALEEKCDRLGQSRPTAVNLAWAIKRMKDVAQSNKSLSVAKLKSRLKEEALTILTRHSHQRSDGTTRSNPCYRWQRDLDSLQCRRPCNSRVWHGIRRCSRISECREKYSRTGK